jgi:hypothetical protein
MGVGLADRVKVPENNGVGPQVGRFPTEHSRVSGDSPGIGTSAKGHVAKRARPRLVFHVETNGQGTVIQILDSISREVFREIPADEFVAFAKTRKDLGALIWGNAKVAPSATAKPLPREHPLS